MKILIGMILNIDGNYYISVTTPDVYNRESDKVFNLYEKLINIGKYNNVEITVVETKNSKLITKSIQRNLNSITYHKLSDELLEELLDDKIIKNVRFKKGMPKIVSENEFFGDVGNWEMMTIV